MAEITKEAAEKKLGKLKELSEKKKYLNAVLKEVKDEELKKDIKSLRTPEIIKGKPVAEYEIVYDSFGEALEPVYYWILDFLKDKNFGMGYDVSKADDYFAASEASSFYGEMGGRRTALEKRATELMGTINVVVKSIINLVYDLKEFDMRFESYEKLKSSDSLDREAGDQALKGIWLTEVDMKKGAAAINALVQNLNFIMLREAFVALDTSPGKDIKETEKIALKKADEMEMPEQTKRILKARITEYVRWRELSEKELRKRYGIEKAYLKSQVAALKLYTRWAKPYLIATQKLLPPDLKLHPEAIAELATPFNVAYTYLEIFATKKVNKIAGKELPIEDPETPHVCIDVSLSFRASPSLMERGQYVQRGKADIKFKSYMLSKQEIEDLKNAEDDIVLKLIDEMTKETLDAMKDDLDEYTKEKKPEKKEEPKKKGFEMPFKKDIEELKKGYETVKGHAKKISGAMGKIAEGPMKRQMAWNLKRLQNEAEKKAKKDGFTLYDVYKLSHGMTRW